MASSKKLPKNNLVTSKSSKLLSHLKLFLRDFFLEQKRIQSTLLVAYSGGLDSTVLLHALHQLQAELPIHLRAMHVHHGLSDNANQWAALCERTCVDLNIPLTLCHANVDQSNGDGIEAAARKVRYQALLAEEADYICVGHHQDDQAETLLLQLARGAGVKGLAGMAQVDIDRRLIRPFLNLARLDLLQYAKQHQLQWVEDESNVKTHFDRNFIRHELIPTFSQQYSNVSQTLARSARHMAQASAMLDDLALLDANVAIKQLEPHGAIQLEELYVLSEARQANLVRWWLANNQINMPSSALLTQILKQLQSKRTDAAVKVKVSEGFYVRRYKAMAFLVAEVEKLPLVDLLWQGEDVVELPNRSRLFFKEKMGEGIAYKRSKANVELRIRSRVGGERFMPELGRPRRSLKTMMQVAGLPPWQREQLPYIFLGETLAVIPNIAVDVNLKAKSDEPGLVVHWLPASS